MTDAVVVDFASHHTRAQLLKSRASSGKQPPAVLGQTAQLPDAARTFSQMSRFTAMKNLSATLDQIKSGIAELNAIGVSCSYYQAGLSEQKPLIEEVLSFFPPAEPELGSFGQLEESMTYFTADEAATVLKLMPALQELIDTISGALSAYKELPTLAKCIARTRRTSTAMELAQPDWEDEVDLDLSAVIEYAADPVRFLDQCDTWLKEARTALDQQRWTEAYMCIEQIKKVCAYLTIPARALLSGGLVMASSATPLTACSYSTSEPPLG